MRGADYPWTKVVGHLANAMSKEQWIAVCVDLIRSRDENLSDQEIIDEVVEHLDILAANKIVPRTVSRRVFPRPARDAT